MHMKCFFFPSYSNLKVEAYVGLWYPSPPKKNTGKKNVTVVKHSFSCGTVALTVYLWGASYSSL
jgi:hypothetical protein